MAHNKPKTYTPKFKFQLVLEVLQGERSEVEIGRTYGVHHTTISKWKRHFLEHGAEVFSGNEEVEREAIETGFRDQIYIFRAPF